MSSTVDFHFDFSSPNAYFVHKLIPGIEERTGATFNYVPALLGGIFKSTGNLPPMIATQNIPNKQRYLMAEAMRFTKRHQIPFKMNPHFPIHSVNLMRVALVVESMGTTEFKQYIDTVFDGIWLHGLKLDDPSVLQQVLTEAGLPAEDIMTQSQHPDIKQQLKDNTQLSVDKGAFGMPTFFIGEEMFFGKETLPEIEERLQNSV